MHVVDDFLDCRWLLIDVKPTTKKGSIIPFDTFFRLSGKSAVCLIVK